MPLERRLCEVPVDVACALQKFLKSLAADGEFRNQADRRPHRIAAAHPIPHGEPVVGGNAEGIHGRGIGRYRDEVIRGRLLPQSADDPGARRVGIRLGFLGDECLRANDDQGFRGIDAADQILELSAIHIGHKMRRDSAAPLMFEGVADEKRPQIRAADADIHDVFEFLARGPEFSARPHGGGEIGQLLARVAYLRLNGRGTREVRAQRRVQYCTLLGAVDRVAAKHRRPARRQVRGARQIEQQRQGLGGDSLARHIEQPGVMLDMKALPPLGICGGQIAQMRVLQFLGMRSNRAPFLKRRIQLCHQIFGTEARRPGSAAPYDCGW